MDKKAIVKGFVVKELLNGNCPDPLDDDQDLLISGLVDSLGVVRLINFIEQTLDISVPPEDVTLENFQSIQCMSVYLDGRSES